MINLLIVVQFRQLWEKFRNFYNHNEDVINLILFICFILVLIYGIVKLLIKLFSKKSLPEAGLKWNILNINGFSQYLFSNKKLTLVNCL